MLQKLGDHIANCLARAVDAELRAAEAPSEALRIDNERMAKSWRHLAGSYQFVESLERFLLDAEKAKRAQAPEPLVPDPPVKTEAPMFPPVPGITFDPETLAVLTAAYNNAIEGQSTADHEAIAKRIVALASEGELDPHRLCQGALALSARKRRQV